jgi:creatinine amidohydrolase
VLPAIPFGVNTAQLDIPMCINVNPSTQTAILRDVSRSLAPHGVRYLVLLNGHGGNDFKPAIRELLPEGGPTIYAVDWWRAADAAAVFAEPGDHAGELETSVVQHLAPELVLPLAQAGPGRERRSRLAAVREGWAWTPRPWTRITDDTGVGDPSAASAGKGERFLDEAARRIAGFLVELAALEPNDAWA